MRTPEQIDALMARIGEPIDPSEHVCSYPWCTGTIWRGSHHGTTETPITGRSADVVEAVAVGVHVVYDECEDPRPRILLHIGSDIDDVDAGPTAAEARRIAIALLQAADAIDGARR